ncbi:MAG: DMT family transporter [Oleiphilus sp.]
MKQFFLGLPLGMRFMILSAFGFSVMAVCVKFASLNGIPVLEIVAARAFVSLVLSYADIHRKGIPAFGRNKTLLFARGLVGTFALICVYYAITNLPLAEATVLQYLYPVFTAVLALFFLKERIHWTLVLSILLSFIGLLLVVRPAFLFAEFAHDLSNVAVLAGVLGAFGSGIAYVLVRKLSQTEDSSVIIFYFPFIALPFSLILLAHGNDFVVPDLATLGLLVLVGIFTQVGQVGLTKAMQTETAGRASAFAYLQVVFAAIFGWMFFQEIPDIGFVVGAIFILFGVLVNLLYKQKIS